VANHSETPITLTDAPDDEERAVIMDGLRAYNEAQAGGSDACPLAILASSSAMARIRLPSRPRLRASRRYRL
jgi:hypothetical protein